MLIKDMRVNIKYYTIYQAAMIWKVNTFNVMQLVIANELKASVLQKDGGITTYDTFSDIPEDLRDNLKVVRPRGIRRSIYDRLLKCWDPIIITDEEMDRYAAKNPLKNTLTTQKVLDSEHPKSNRSLQIIIATMAIKGYSYKPRDTKSNVATEITKDANELGLSISEKTVREWLKKSISVLDGDKY